LSSEPTTHEEGKGDRALAERRMARGKRKRVGGDRRIRVLRFFMDVRGKDKVWEEKTRPQSLVSVKGGGLKKGAKRRERPPLNSKMEVDICSKSDNLA